MAASRYAVVRPEIPAPMMHTLARMSCLTAGRSGTSVVFIQTEVVWPESLRISLIYSKVIAA